MRKHRGLFAVLCAGTLLLGAIACESSDKVPPADSTISLSANPAQIIIQDGLQIIPVTLIATVRNSIGVPLSGQDVRFTTTNGVLAPTASTPVRTDSLGNAFATLDGASQGPQVTATAGKATVSLTLTAGTAAVCFLTLSPSSAQTITDCNTDTFDFDVLAEDCDRQPVDGVRVFIEFVSPNKDAVAMNPSPSNGVTDASGLFTTTVSLDANSCNTLCSDPDKDCRTQIRAKDQAGFIFSNVVDILDGIQ